MPRGENASNDTSDWKIIIALLSMLSLVQAVHRMHMHTLLQAMIFFSLKASLDGLLLDGIQTHTH